jgi:hypothetical protein
MEYKTKTEMYKKVDEQNNGSENLLEQVLSDVKPLVSSVEGNKYSINERPTELSSGGYVYISPESD